MICVRVLACWAVLAIGFSPIGAKPPPKPVFLYASVAGGRALDQDADGGNPFATALVQSLARPSASFADFRKELIALTHKASRGKQQAEVVGGEPLAGWQFLPKPKNATWVALVVVFSDYSASGMAYLPGAKRDERRISKALTRAGFVVTPLLNPDRRALAHAMKDFASRSAHADVAVVYTTGHGVEVEGVPRLLLPWKRADRSNALPLAELASTALAKRANLIFFGACRLVQSADVPSERLRQTDPPRRTHPAGPDHAGETRGLSHHQAEETGGRRHGGDDRSGHDGVRDRLHRPRP